MSPFHIKVAQPPAAGRVKGAKVTITKLSCLRNTKELFNGFNPLHGAVWFGKGEVVRSLIAHGARVNARSNIGLTPLHSAASPVYGTVEGKREVVVKLLLDAGADTEAEDEKGTLFLLRDGR